MNESEICLNMLVLDHVIEISCMNFLKFFFAIQWWICHLKIQNFSDPWELLWCLRRSRSGSKSYYWVKSTLSIRLCQWTLLFEKISIRNRVFKPVHWEIFTGTLVKLSFKDSIKFETCVSFYFTYLSLDCMQIACKANLFSLVKIQWYQQISRVFQKSTSVKQLCAISNDSKSDLNIPNHGQ